nr:hypothetical protein [Tanacetum cinerariifolium]
LSLNISPRWISRLRPGQPLPSLKQLQRHGIPPQRIVFEITELGGDSQRLSDVVARYREAGARIAIDDFGAGYSQLDRAEMEFFAADAFVERFAELRDRYVMQKVVERERLMNLRKQLSQLMLRLQAWAEGDAPLGDLPDV